MRSSGQVDNKPTYFMWLQLIQILPCPSLNVQRFCFWSFPSLGCLNFPPLCCLNFPPISNHHFWSSFAYTSPDSLLKPKALILIHLRKTVSDVEVKAILWSWIMVQGVSNVSKHRADWTNCAKNILVNWHRHCHTNFLEEKVNFLFNNASVGLSSLLIDMVALKRAGVLFSRPKELVVYPPNPYRVRPCLLRA